VTLVHCGQMAAWIKMKRGIKVGLGPGDIVLYGDPASPKKGAQPPPPIFGPCLLWPNGWMDQCATWYRGRPRPRPHCVRWGLSSPQKGHSPSNFRPMSVVAKRSPISATAEHLLIFLLWPIYRWPQQTWAENWGLCRRLHYTLQLICISYYVCPCHTGL